MTPPPFSTRLQAIRHASLRKHGYSESKAGFLFCAIAHAKTWPNQHHRHHADINFQGISMG
jgi:hypothetical protein